MAEVSFSSLAVILVATFVAPLALGLLPRVRLPAMVVEIVLGILIGPSVLGWAETDGVVRVLDGRHRPRRTGPSGNGRPPRCAAQCEPHHGVSRSRV